MVKFECHFTRRKIKIIKARFFVIEMCNNISYHVPLAICFNVPSMTKRRENIQIRIIFSIFFPFFQNYETRKDINNVYSHGIVFEIDLCHI